MHIIRRLINPVNLNYALNKYYQQFSSNEVNSNFVPGTFGYEEAYNTFYINYLQDNVNAYASGNPYLFVSAGSGAGPGFMYLNWIIVTYGIPYIVNIS